MNRPRFGHNLQHLHARIQRRVGVLKDRLHLASQRAHLSPRGAGKVDAVYAHASAAWHNQAQNHPRHRGLSRAGFADQPQRFAGLDLKRDIFDNGLLLGPQSASPGIALGDGIDLNQRHGSMLHLRHARHRAFIDGAI